MAAEPARTRAAQVRFSPLHEGDASVAPTSPVRLVRACMFQSPSRGGRLCGVASSKCPSRILFVSVPFTRGTPLWRWRPRLWSYRPPMFQSPSRGGRLCGPCLAPFRTRPEQRFSPLHEGDASVAAQDVCAPTVALSVSVPFTRGTPLWPSSALDEDSWRPGFQSPSRGGRLCGGQVGLGQVGPVQVFQSPSRGGRLCGPRPPQLQWRFRPRFSPLHEGDASVAPRSCLGSTAQR